MATQAAIGTQTADMLNAAATMQSSAATQTAAASGVAGAGSASAGPAGASAGGASAGAATARGWIIVLGADDSHNRAQFEINKTRGQGFADGKVYHWRRNATADWLWIPTIGPYPSEAAATRDQARVAALVGRDVDVQALREWCGGDPIPKPLTGYDKDGYDECPY